MIVGNIEDFVKAVPTAIGSDYERLRPFLAEAEIYLMNHFLTHEIVGKIELNGQLFDSLFSYVCVRAYLNAVSQLDLIQSNNGFAVVSNPNLAPASKERVEKLKESLGLRLTTLSDSITFAVMENKELKELFLSSSYGKWVTSSLIYTAHELSFCFMSDVWITDLKFRQLRPRISEIETRIGIHYISMELMEHLKYQKKNGSLTLKESILVESLKTAIGLMLTGKLYTDTLDNALILINDNLADFPAYAGSKLFVSKTEGYVNSADSPIYVMLI